MKAQSYKASILDEFIADRKNTLDWLIRFGSVEGTGHPAFIRHVGTIPMGSTTYEWLQGMRSTRIPNGRSPGPMSS